MEVPMRSLSIRELRAALPELEDILAREGEMNVTRHGRVVCRLVPVEQAPVKVPSLADLRARMKPVAIPSEVLIREDRDGR